MKRTAVGLLLLALVLATPWSQAHAEPWHTTPESGERLAESPTQVIVSFTEPVYKQGSWIEVWDLSGHRVDLDDMVFSDDGDTPVMQVSVPELDDGPYIIRWQTYSQTDGHTIRGAIGFSVGGFVPPAVDATEDFTPVSAAIARALITIGYTMAIGAIGFLWVVLRPVPGAGTPRAVDVAILGGALLHLIGLMWLMADTAVATGIGMVEYLSSEGGQDLWMRALVAAGMVILSVLWLFGPVRPRITMQTLAILWVVAVALGARFGHSEGITSWFVQTAHAISIATWIGGLVLLLLFLLAIRPGPGAMEKVRTMGIRFSTLGLAAVALMALTGLALSLTILGPSLLDPTLAFSDQWRSFLTVKIILAAGMVVLALINREFLLASDKDTGSIRRGIRWLAKAVSGGNGPGRQARIRDLRFTVGLEAATGVAVIVMAGLLMSVAPPSSVQGASLGPSDTLLLDGDNHTAVATFDPVPIEGRISDMIVQVAERGGEAVTPDACIMATDNSTGCIFLRWWPSGRPWETREAEALPYDEDSWIITPVEFQRDGHYRFKLRIDVPGLTTGEVSAFAEVQPAPE